MFNITQRGMDTDIYLTRGDTFDCIVTIYDADGEEYTPATGDEVMFGMKLNYTDTTPVLEKQVDTSTMLLTIEADETEALTMGLSYVYDIQLRTAGNSVYTFVKGRLYLGEEVTA